MAAILSPVSHALTSLTHALPPRGRVVVTLVHVVLDRAVRRASSDVAPGPRSASTCGLPPREPVR